MDRTQFTFYESFYQSLQRIRSKEERLDAYDAICTYALYGREPDLNALTDMGAVVFMLIKPNLDASRRKAESGKLGGSKTKAKQKQNGREGETEKENKKEKELELEIELELEREGEGKCPAPAREERETLPETPTFEQVRTEAVLRGCPDLARNFFDYYDAAGWRDAEGRPVYHWQQKLVAWQQREAKQSGRARRDWTEVAREMDREEGLI